MSRRHLAERARASAALVRRWDVWTLPDHLRRYIILVVTGAVAAVIAAAVSTQWRPRDLLLFAALAAAGVIVTEAGRGIQVAHGTLTRDMLAVWFIASAILLPPFYVLVTPIALAAVRQLRLRGVLHRGVFSAAACGLAYVVSSLAFHATPARLAGPAPGGGTHVLTWTAALAVCGALGLVINNALVIGAVRLSEPGARLRDLVLSREAVFTDLVQLSYAFAITLPVAINPFLLPATVPIVLAQRRFMMHAQLLAQSRIDAKTGLLNAATWQREAAVELARAIRTQTPMAVAMVDLDHFKRVNDDFGHLAGDLVLREFARTLRGSVRDYDVVGRFGGEEFMLLLPQTDPLEAITIAERLREQVARQEIAIDDGSRKGLQLRLTISIGVASLGGARRDLNDLIAAADNALYQAKKGGRNQVRMLGEVPAFDRAGGTDFAAPS